MAKLFLSYSRNDIERIEPLVKVLEEEGHSVWWDRRLKGGSEFDAVIDKALADADWVLVAWSEAASRSAWVRDEAAVGRDRRCLVPLTLDGSLPPLGFRQYQTIDLSRWSGRGRPRQVDELIQALAGPAADHGADATVIHTPQQRKRFAVGAIAVTAIGAILLITVIGGGLWWAQRSQAATPTVAIEAGNGSEVSQEAARDLTANLQPASGGEFQLVPDKAPANFVLQISAANDKDNLRRDLTLVSNGSIEWSTTLSYDAHQPDDLSRMLPVIFEQLLTCAIEAHGARIDPATVKLYLRGCAQLLSLSGFINYDMPAAQLLQQVVRNAPRFEDGWAKLLQATEGPNERAHLRSEIAQVEKLGFKPGELYVAKALLLPPQDLLGRLALLEAGSAADPDNPRLRKLYAWQLATVGRLKDAIVESGRAVQLNPVAADFEHSYIMLLGEGGEVEKAHELMNSLRLKWPNSVDDEAQQFLFERDFGDPSTALMIYRDGVAPSVVTNKAEEDFILARIDPSPATVERALDDARTHYAKHPSSVAQFLQVLGQFGHVDEAIDLMVHYGGPDTIVSPVIFEPAMRNVWRDPRSMAAAAHLGLLRYWKASQHWPDFCFEPDLPYNCKKVAGKLDANAFAPLRPAQPDHDFVSAPLTAKCHDGNLSFSPSASGACAMHGGVARWLSSESSR